jgi:hypothetical protein
VAPRSVPRPRCARRHGHLKGCEGPPFGEVPAVPSASASVAIYVRSERLHVVLAGRLSRPAGWRTAYKCPGRVSRSLAWHSLSVSVGKVRQERRLRKRLVAVRGCAGEVRCPERGAWRVAWAVISRADNVAEGAVVQGLSRCRAHSRLPYRKLGIIIDTVSVGCHSRRRDAAGPCFSAARVTHLLPEPLGEARDFTPAFT